MGMQEVLREFAKNSIKCQVERPGDFYKNGYLYCGKCKKPRQMSQKYEFEQLDGKKKVEYLKVAIRCDCDIEAEKRKKEEEAKRIVMSQIGRLKRLSLMDEKFVNATFETAARNKYNERNYQRCVKYVDKFSEMLKKGRGLLFWGDVGTGKSYAAACIANGLMQKGVPVIMTSFVKILTKVNKSEDNTLEKRLESVSLVIFDDLGAERDTGYALERIYAVIDSRIRSGLPMVITTNLTLEEIKSETDMRYKRIYDRIIGECYPMQFTGPSWRKQSAFSMFNDMEEMFNQDE